MSNEQQLDKLKKDYSQYQKELEQLQLSVNESKEYEGTPINVDKQLTKIRKKLDDSYNKILNLQEKIALELKARRL